MLITRRQRAFELARPSSVREVANVVSDCDKSATNAVLILRGRERGNVARRSVGVENVASLRMANSSESCALTPLARSH